MNDAAVAELVVVKAETPLPADAQKLTVEVSELLAKAPGYHVITNQEQLTVGVEMLSRLREAKNNREKQRKFMKAPILEAGERIDAQFRPLQEALDAEIKAVNTATTAYMNAERARQEEIERARRKAEQDRLEAEARERREQERLAREEQERQQRERDEQLRKAAEADAAGKKAEADAALKAAADAEASAASAGAQATQAATEATQVTQAAESVAAAPLDVEIRTTGVLGSKSKLKPVKTYKIVDITKVPEMYLVPAEDRINKALVRANMNADVAIPGIDYIEEFTTNTKASRV